MFFLLWIYGFFVMKLWANCVRLSPPDLHLKDGEKGIHQENGQRNRSRDLNGLQQIGGRHRPGTQQELIYRPIESGSRYNG